MSVAERGLGTSAGSEKILRAQVDDYRCGYGLRLVIGTVDVQATYRQETRATRVNRSRNHYQVA